ncbi:ABC transporter ATP-binding protein (plasmid) [Paenibacillus cellulosilyticus]|uniref:ABC transporter ATP-binding protein n=1 Tax=Paenibacillus cellulosilyticus TaxID=375489 RepID=UPI000D719CFD|nr:ABC transporter ATP-binding protein [Paenibacillus cellulosilyticus]QKS43354.1 ABC transporter ATP-binding protein [Paenibacillus cellulosilyticus]
MLRRFYTYAKPYKGLFYLDFFCAVLCGALELSFPLIVNYVIDDLLPSGDIQLILWACLGLLVVYGISSVLQYVFTYWGHQFGISIETDMRRKLFDQYQRLSFRFYDNNKTGNLTTRITNDLLDIGELAHHGPEDIFIAGMTLVGSFTLMMYINWQLAIMTFIIVPLLLWLAGLFFQRMTLAYNHMFSDIASINARVEDNIGGIRVVQAFANEAYEKSLFAENNKKFFVTKMKGYKIMAKNFSISYMLTRMVSVFAMLCGAWFVINDKMSYGEFISFLLLTNLLYQPINKLNTALESYTKGVAGFKRYLEIIDEVPDIREAPDAINLPSVRGDIHYKNITFGYEGHANVLSNVSFSIRAGETVAFVGPSGAGKSTICSLLPRFYDPGQGVITLDGIDIKDLSLNCLRTNIGVVQQDVFLFSGTLRDNIAYGMLNAGEAEIWEAARRARIDDFIRSQPDGLDTVIGERGVKLSGGQKQRVAIARMFLKNPPILILDEATSALDTETELLIQQSLDELSKGRTTLIIAHRLATIKNADRIIVVTDKGISEQGHHNELVTGNGLYSRLYTAQFRSG